MQEHGLPSAHEFTDWRDLADAQRLADVAIVATQDHMHVEPTVALAERGYHILLEKPMAPDEAGCRRIVEAVHANGVYLGVAHVLRYTPYTRALKAALEAGVIGDIVSIQHLEPVGYWHQAHSYVRGNWRSERASSPMILSKSCHDLDWIKYIVGSQCVAISSFGNLAHFRPENRPPDASDRCLTCGCEETCPYSAKKIYLTRAQDGHFEWPVDTLTDDLTYAGVEAALRGGPYGRCVYACDNDVVDHQVVNMLFAGGQTASFTMTGFNQYQARKTRIFGTSGAIEGDGYTISSFDFLTDTSTEVRVESTDHTLAGGHAGGDDGLMTSFLSAVSHGRPDDIISDAVESLGSHVMAFRAETARRSDTVEHL